jgi:hypothetical protein
LNHIDKEKDDKKHFQLNDDDQNKMKTIPSPFGFELKLLYDYNKSILPLNQIAKDDYERIYLKFKQIIDEFVDEALINKEEEEQDEENSKKLLKKSKKNDETSQIQIVIKQEQVEIDQTM